MEICRRFFFFFEHLRKTVSENVFEKCTCGREIRMFHWSMVRLYKEQFAVLSWPEKVLSEINEDLDDLLRIFLFFKCTSIKYHRVIERFF